MEKNLLMFVADDSDLSEAEDLLLTHYLLSDRNGVDFWFRPRQTFCASANLRIFYFSRDSALCYSVFCHFRPNGRHPKTVVIDLSKHFDVSFCFVSFMGALEVIKKLTLANEYFDCYGYMSAQ